MGGLVLTLLSDKGELGTHVGGIFRIDAASRCLLPRVELTRLGGRRRKVDVLHSVRNYQLTRIKSNSSDDAEGELCSTLPDDLFPLRMNGVDELGKIQQVTLAFGTRSEL